MFGRTSEASERRRPFDLVLQLGRHSARAGPRSRRLDAGLDRRSDLRRERARCRRRGRPAGARRPCRRRRRPGSARTASVRVPYLPRHRQVDVAVLGRRRLDALQLRLRVGAAGRGEQHRHAGLAEVAARPSESPARPDAVAAGLASPTHRPPPHPATTRGQACNVTARRPSRSVRGPHRLQSLADSCGALNFEGSSGGLDPLTVHMPRSERALWTLVATAPARAFAWRVHAPPREAPNTSLHRPACPAAAAVGSDPGRPRAHRLRSPRPTSRSGSGSRGCAIQRPRVRALAGPAASRAASSRRSRTAACVDRVADPAAGALAVQVGDLFDRPPARGGGAPPRRARRLRVRRTACRRGPVRRPTGEPEVC